LSFVAALSSSFLASSPLDVGGAEDVETGQDTGTGDTTEDVGAGTLHEGHETFAGDDLLRAIDGTVVLDSGATGHHHASSDGIDWVGHDTGDNGYTPTEEETEKSRAVIADEHWLERVVKTKVHTSVDEDTDAGDDETSVETTDTVGGEGLSVDIDETVVLSLTTLGLVVVSQSSTGVVEGVDNGQGHGTSETTGSDVDGEFLPGWCVLWTSEHSLDAVLEGKVKSLCWEVSENIGHVTSPEWNDTFGLERSHGTVDDASVWLVESALLDHLILVLDEELDSLNWCGGSLRHAGGDTGEHEALEESKLLRHGGRVLFSVAETSL